MSADQLLSAEALGLTRVKVLFGNGGVPAASADATPFDVAAWELVADPDSALPSFTPFVSAVEELAGDLGVILTTDTELTSGVGYTAVVTGVTGIVENAVDNVVGFQAYPITSAPSTRLFELLKFVPRINLSEDDTEDCENFIACLQEPLNLLFNDVDRWIEILDCDLAPENFVDLILADLGNPFVFEDPLSLTEKRKLCRLLVEIYKLKGTAAGMQAAILFFIGLRSEFVAFNGLGDQLEQAASVTGAELSDAVSDSPTPFILGVGTAFWMICKLGTIEAEAGSFATDQQIDRALKIIRIMKPAGLFLVKINGGFVRSGAPPSQRNSIKDNGATVDLIMQEIPICDAHIFLEQRAPGVQEFNADTQVAATPSGGVAVASAYTPGGVRYWNGVGNNTGDNTIGLLSNEVTNALTKPVLAVAAGVRKLTLTWAAVTGATSYRIYRSVATFTSPTLADNADAPIEVSGDLTSYEDPMESAAARFYRITPVIGANDVGAFAQAFDSEGFFSDEQTGTAL